MLATTPAKSKIVLLAHRNPAELTDLDPNEGPSESRLAVAQDIWGPGNLTPLDNVFASTAIGVLAVTSKAKFGVLCHHLGSRLFRFSRDIDVWIDAYECDPVVSLLQKRPKDKIKLNAWDAAGRPLGTNRFTKLAVLNMNGRQLPFARIASEAADALRPGGELFLAGLVGGTSGATAVRPEASELLSLAKCKDAVSETGLTVDNEVDLSEGVKSAIRKGLYDSIAALSSIRKLKQPWKSQRLTAYLKEIEIAAGLYMDLDDGRVTAAGLHAVKP